MLTDPLAEAIAEAEKLVESAPHIRSEQDLLEGMQYLAGGILATVHAAWATEKTHPSFIQGTGPFTKMGLDNPDTLYFGARINDDAEYIVTGTRGTTGLRSLLQSSVADHVLRHSHRPVLIVPPGR